MPVMYVDDSGSPSYRDRTNYFILAGIIVNDDKIKSLQRTVLEYKHSNFRDEFVDAEVHTYDISHSRGYFKLLDQPTKSNLLNKLYEMIADLDCAGIIVAIGKNRLQKERPTWNVFNTAWLLLLKRYEAFLQENTIDIGKIMADKSSNRLHHKVSMIIQAMIENDTDSQKFSRITQPTFADSAGVYGIQIADAFAYCTLKHKINDYEFARHWDVIYDKIVRDETGMITGYFEYPE